MVTVSIDYCDWCYFGYSEYTEPSHYDLNYKGESIDLCDECFKEYQEEMEGVKQK
jgi:hypothetical protein